MAIDKIKENIELTIRPLRKASIAITIASGAAFIFFGLGAAGQSLDSLWSWLNLAICLGLAAFFFYLTITQTLGYIKVSETSLTALQSWAKGTGKADMDKFIRYSKRTIAFSDIAGVALQSAEWEEIKIPVMKIKLNDQSQWALRTGAFRKEDIQKVITWLNKRNIKTDI